MPSSPPAEPTPPPESEPAPSSRRRLSVLALGGLVALVATGIIVVVLTRSEPSTDIRSTQVSVAGVASVGERAPGFIMPSLTGSGDVRLDAGRPTVLTFWASWCAPCRKEFPLLKAAGDADPDLLVFGVVYKDIPADARAFADEEQATWPNAIDSGGDVASAYGVRAIPQTFFIDRSGVIRGRVFGLSSKAQLERELAKIR